MQQGWRRLAWLGFAAVVAIGACKSKADEGECHDDADCDEGEICDEYECVEADDGGSTGGPSGGTGGVPTPQCKAYPEPIAIAALNEGLGPAPEPQLSVLFSDKGSIQFVGGTACAPVESSIDTSTLGTNWMTCFESYDCGGCEVWAGYYEGDGGDFPEAWYLISRDDAEGCARFNAFYRLIGPEIAASGGGDVDGQVVPGESGGGDACGDCLSSCSGLSSCCTGSGCACESACQPTGCVQGLALCCGIGSCICTSNCPY